MEEVATSDYREIRSEIKSGDILFCSGSAFFSTLIQKATHSHWSHIGIILRLDIIDRVMVLESVESIGVRAVPLSNYVSNYNGTGKSYPGQIMLARHKNLKQENLITLSKVATSLLGYPYNTEEIIRIATRISMNAISFPKEGKDPIPNREFICSEYAYICFKSIGIEINYNQLGFIAPADFANCDQIYPMRYINNASKATAI